MSERDDLINERYVIESDIADIQTELDNLTERLSTIDARISVLDETEDADAGARP